MTAWFDEHVLDRWTVTAKGLALLRVLYASVALLTSLPDWRWAGRLPHAVWAPPLGLLRVVPGAPPVAVITVLQDALAVALVALLVGWRTRIASWTVAVVGTVGSGIIYSSGNLDHGFLPVLMAALMSFSGWGAAWSVDAARGRITEVAAWPITMLAWCLGLAMLGAAWPKVDAGWLRVGTHAARGHLVEEYVVNHRQQLLADQAMRLSSGRLWELLDYLTVVLEGGFVLAVLWVRSTRVFVAAAAVFHLAIILMMNISFVSNLVVYAAFVDWTWLASRVRVPAWSRAVAARPVIPGVVVVAGIGAAVLSDRAGPPLVALVGLFTDRSLLLVHTALIVAGATVAIVFLARECGTLARSLLVPARRARRASGATAPG